MRQNQAGRPVPHAKNRADALDWDRVIDSYTELSAVPEDLLASEGEQDRILAVYNRALKQARTDNSDIAKIALEKLTASWPQFAQAASLYGVLLAKERRYRDAEEQFEKVLLASPDTALAKAVDRFRLAAREERIREEARDNRRKRGEKLLVPVRAHMAKSGILQRAADEDGTGRVQMASRREQGEVLRMEEGMALDSRRSFGSLNRLIQGLAAAVIAVTLIFLIFYFAIRPSILRNEDRRERLEWLERVLNESREDETVAGILDLYRKTFPGMEGQ